MRFFSKRKSWKKNRTSVRCSRRRIKRRDSRSKKRYSKHPKFRSSYSLKNYAENLKQEHEGGEQRKKLLNALYELCDELDKPNRSTERVEDLKKMVQTLSSDYIDTMKDTAGNQKYAMQQMHKFLHENFHDLEMTPTDRFGEKKIEKNLTQAFIAERDKYDDRGINQSERERRENEVPFVVVGRKRY